MRTFLKFTSLLFLLTSFNLFADLPVVQLPNYPEANRIADNDAPSYREALALEVKRLNIKLCASRENYVLYLRDWFLTSKNTTSSWYILDTNEPLIAMLFVFPNKTQTEDYPKRSGEFLFYTNSDFTKLERVQYREYVTQYENVNYGNLARPDVRNVLVTRLAATSYCE